MSMKSRLLVVLSLAACSGSLLFSTDSAAGSISGIAGAAYYPGDADCLYRDSFGMTNHCDHAVRYELAIPNRNGGYKQFKLNYRSYTNHGVTCWVKVYDETTSQMWYSGSQTGYDQSPGHFHFPDGSTVALVGADMVIAECDLAQGYQNYGYWYYPAIYGVTWTD